MDRPGLFIISIIIISLIHGCSSDMANEPYKIGWRQE